MQILRRSLLWVAPHLMKSLSILGTAAMFLVGGGILLHGLHAEEALHHAGEIVGHLPGIGGVLAAITPLLLNALAGVIAGGLVLLGVNKAKAYLEGPAKAA